MAWNIVYRDAEAPIGDGVGVAALNLGPGARGPGYYGNSYPFINLVRTGAGWSNNGGGTVDSDYHINNLPNNGQAVYWMFIGETNYAYFPPGAYYCKAICDSGNVDCTVDSTTNVSSITAGTSANSYRGSFTVGNSPDGMDLRVRCTNNSGSSKNIIDLIVCRQSDWTACVDQGEIFHPDFLNYISNAQTLRNMDWMRTNFTNISSPAEMIPESKMTWGYAGNSGLGGVPFSVFAKLGVKTGKQLWVCMPTGTSKYKWTASGTTITVVDDDLPGNPMNHGFSNDEKVMWTAWEAGHQPTGLSHATAYWVVNATATTFGVSATQGGSPISVGNPAEGYARLTVLRANNALFAAIAAEMYAVAPNINLVVEYSNEVWNTGGAFPFHEVNQAVTVANGFPQYNWVEVYAHLSFVAWKAFETAGYQRNQITRVVCSQHYGFGVMAGMFDEIDSTGIIQLNAPLKNLVDEHGSAPYITFGNAGYLEANNAATQNDAFFYNIFINIGTGAPDWETVDVVAGIMASNVAALAAINPAIKYTTYECGFQVVVGSTTQAIKDRFITWLQSQSSADLYEYYYQEVFVAHGVTRFQHYAEVAGIETDLRIYHWGLSKNTEAQSYRKDWFDALPTS